MHAVQSLYLQRKSISTKPFNARGKKVIRCDNCRVSVKNCICHLTPKVQGSHAGFLLLMYDTEVLKPSNTGRLIADIIPDTYAFLWSRTEPNEALSELLSDTQWQPVVVFPHEYADETRKAFINEIPALSEYRNTVSSVKTKETSIKPLFILLDGSWREAKKMFRKSPYLDEFPVVSFTPPVQEETEIGQYIRASAKGNQLATAEVASAMLSIYGEEENATLLKTWFDVFNYQYQKSVCQLNKGDKSAIERLERLKDKKS